MFVDSILNQLKIGLGDGSFSDGDGQHDQRITERTHGRQQKMHENVKNLVPGGSVEKLAGSWVEMKNRGLKIGEILDGWTY